MPVYKNEEKNTWYASFYYTDWTGQRKRKKKEGFALKRDALEYERKFKLQQSGSCEMSFAEMAELYLADCKTRQKPTSYHVKENGIQKHILPYFKDFPVNAITVGQVRQWQNTLLDSGKYSQNYLHTINGYLSAIFNHAVKFYGLRSNPSKECGKIKEIRPQLHFWTKEEFDTFMEQLGEVYPARTMFLLLFWTGMRSGEMLALTLNDFDFEKHTVQISKTYARFQKADLVQTPKTQKSNRLISIPPFLEEEIKAHVQRLYGYSPEERLFSLTSHYLLYYIEKISLQEGLPKIRLHDLRHPYVKHTTKIFSLRLKFFQAQPVPDALRNTRGALERGNHNSFLQKMPCNLCWWAGGSRVWLPLRVHLIKSKTACRSRPFRLILI